MENSYAILSGFIYELPSLKKRANLFLIGFLINSTFSYKIGSFVGPFFSALTLFIEITLLITFFFIIKVKVPLSSWSKRGHFPTFNFIYFFFSVSIVVGLIQNICQKDLFFSPPARYIVRDSKPDCRF